MGWRHSGFNVHCGPRMQPGDELAMENLARYTCHAEALSEGGLSVPSCPACVGMKYYGYYSNVNRGKRKMRDKDELIPSILEPEESSRDYK